MKTTRFAVQVCALLLTLFCAGVLPAGSAAPRTAKIAFTSTRDGNAEIYVMNPDGSKLVNLTQHAAKDGAPAWSPTGEQIAFNSDRGGVRDIYLMDPDGKNVRKVLKSSAYRDHPTWSSDGTKLAYLRAGDWAIYTADIARQTEQKVASTGFVGGFPAWSPTTAEIAFIFVQGEGNYHLPIVNLNTGEEKRLLPNNELRMLFHPAWSPLGDKIAFTWLKKGIYVVRRDGKGVKKVVAGARPAWSPDGEKLVYDADGQLFTRDLKRRKSKQLTGGAVNFEGDWFDPGVLPIQPSAALLTTVWGRLKQK